MNEILLPILIVSIIGIIAGLVLSIASIVMHVPKNETVEKILDILPGANCGACGFSGCEGYAKALAEGNSTPGLCSPGGNQVSQKISDILGVTNKKIEPQIAIIKCNGTCENTSKKATYTGINSCSAAIQMYAGGGECSYGCIGFGDCLKACKYDAITLHNGIAQIDANKCVGCGQCAAVCPKNLIDLTSCTTHAIVNCKNLDKGVVTKKACSAGCIGCKLCEKACEYDAIHVKNNLAHIDDSKCTGCGKCKDTCPMGCISIIKIH